MVYLVVTIFIIIAFCCAPYFFAAASESPSDALGAFRDSNIGREKRKKKKKSSAKKHMHGMASLRKRRQKTPELGEKFLRTRKNKDKPPNQFIEDEVYSGDTQAFDLEGNHETTCLDGGADKGKSKKRKFRDHTVKIVVGETKKLEKIQKAEHINSERNNNSSEDNDGIDTDRYDYEEYSKIKDHVLGYKSTSESEKSSKSKEKTSRVKTRRKNRDDDTENSSDELFHELGMGDTLEELKDFREIKDRLTDNRLQEEPLKVDFSEERELYSKEFERKAQHIFTKYNIPSTEKLCEGLEQELVELPIPKYKKLIKPKVEKMWPKKRSSEKSETVEKWKENLGLEFTLDTVDQSEE